MSDLLKALEIERDDGSFDLSAAALPQQGARTQQWDSIKAAQAEAWDGEELGPDPDEDAAYDADRSAFVDMENEE
tara:strand:+ start:335 stop:559 length:225 start_codon:yes stop_codon:yes gene_type:complete